SYTTFDLGELTADGRGASIAVTNSGARPGDAVVQFYVRDIEASLPRPAKELKGFARLHLDAGETATARVDFDDRTFAFARAGWVVEPGDFEVLVGLSSADIRARATITI